MNGYELDKIFVVELSSENIVSTIAGIKRHMGVEKSILGKIFSKPLLWVAAKPPQKGAQTPLFALLEPSNFICHIFCNKLGTFRIGISRWISLPRLFIFY